MAYNIPFIGAYNSNILFAPLVTNGTVLLSVQSELGLTSSSGLVSNWADQSGNGHDFVQSTGANKPSTTAGVNGFPGVLFDGVSSLLVSSLALPAAGTTPTFLWGVWRQITSNPGVSIYCGTASASHTLIATTSPSIFQYSGGSNNTNSGMILNSWFRTETYYTNSASDYLKCGSVSVNTGATGNLSGSSFQLGNAGPIGGRYGNMEVLAWMVLNAEPTAPQLSALSSAVTSKYGGTVGV